jgi:hypothetical protein
MNNRVELEVPEKKLDVITIKGYKFFNGYNQFQCATCLNLMRTEPIGLPIRGRMRRVRIIKECDCPKQKC